MLVISPRYHAMTTQLSLIPANDDNQAPRRLDVSAMDAAPMQHMIDTSIAAIDAVLEAQHPCSLSSSHGKDSTLLTCLVVEAARRRVAAGKLNPPIHIVSVSTGIENPEIENLRAVMSSHLKHYAKAHGIDLTLAVVKPNLSESWWARIIGGKKLPSFPGGSADCSVDMKVKPLTRYANAMQKRYASGKPLVSMIGTRFDESTTRAAAMADRGESAYRPTWVESPAGKRFMMSPIAEWKTEAVFCYLQNVGSGRKYPGFAPDFSETLRVYSDSAGAGCMIEVDPSSTSRGAGCGARTGCHQCVRVQTDSSMQNMLLQPEYHYMRGLAAMRNYLLATRWDFTKRDWVGRYVNPDDSSVAYFPNNYSPAECTRLLRMVLTLDVREARRAAKHQAKLRAGSIPDTAWNRRMSEPQFQNIDMRTLLAIDYHWSAAAFHPPFEALRIYADVMAGNELDIPKIAATPRPESMPKEMIIPGRSGAYNHLQGSYDPTVALLDSHCPVTTHDAASFTVDEEGASMFFQLEMDRVLEEYTGAGMDQAQASARYYLRMGIISYAKGHAGDMMRAMKLGEHRLAHGLNEPDISKRAVPGTPRPKQAAAASANDQAGLWEQQAA